MYRTKRSHRTLPTIAKMIDTFLTDDFFPTTPKGVTVWNRTMPAVNVKETEDQYELEVAAPGMQKADFNVEVDQDVLTISSKKQESTEEKNVENKFTRREFKYTSFNRSFNLPETVDSSKIEASYIDGILRLAIPKKEEAKPVPSRKIEIA